MLVPLTSVKNNLPPSADQPTSSECRPKPSCVSASFAIVRPVEGITQTVRVPPHVGGSSLAVNAIDSPSGEKSGPVSAELELTSGWTIPVATSTSERSAEPQSSGRGDVA